LRYLPGNHILTLVLILLDNVHHLLTAERKIE
jgi:hypothetical protein